MILLNDFARQWEDTAKDAVMAFTEVGASGWYILGREVERFEKGLAEYWGAPHAIGVASGLDAIEISLKALGCGPGDRVLTTALSAFATTLAILKLGATPIFVDTDRFGLMDLDRCRSALTGDSSIRYLVPVHLFGHALDPARLRALRDEFGCGIVEDCAQSIGASHSGAATGTTGQMAATSFYPTKNLGAMGDGGAIVTADPDLAAAARALRDYGQSSKYTHSRIGYNSRLDELHAALLRRVGLERLDAWTARRRSAAEAYLAGIRNPAIQVPGAPEGSESCWHLFPVLVAPDRRAGFMAWLKAQGVMSAVHYPIAAVDQPAMTEGSFETLDALENTRRICGSEVSLPIHPYLSDSEIAEVIGACNRWNG